jgi:hypothetical protein
METVKIVGLLEINMKIIDILVPIFKDLIFYDTLQIYLIAFKIFRKYLFILLLIYK